MPSAKLPLTLSQMQYLLYYRIKAQGITCFYPTAAQMEGGWVLFPLKYWRFRPLNCWSSFSPWFTLQLWPRPWYTQGKARGREWNRWTAFVPQRGKQWES